MKIHKSKRGGEASEAVILKLGEIVLAAVLIIIAVYFIVNIYKTWTSDIKSSKESLTNLMVQIGKVDTVDSESSHTASLLFSLGQDDGKYLYGFNTPNPITVKDRDQWVVKVPKACQSLPCICICEEKQCNEKKIIDCRYSSPSFSYIDSFAVKGKPSENFVGLGDTKVTGANSLAISGKTEGWGNWLGPLNLRGKTWGIKNLYLKLEGNTVYFSDVFTK